MAGVISKVFDDIVAGNDLSDFSIVAEQRAGLGGAILDALVLRPSVGGIGIDLKKFFGRERKRDPGGA